MTENHHPTPEDCLEKAVSLFRGAGVPERPPDETVLARIQETSEHSTQITQDQKSLFQRIKNMNPILRYGIVATVMAAIVLVGIGRQSESVALADVADAVKKYKVVRFKIMQDKIGQKGKAMTMTIYLELNLDRMRMEINDGSGNIVVNIMDLKKKKHLGIMTKDKKAFRMDIPGTRKTADSFFGWLKNVQTDEKNKATKELLFGKEVLVYRLKEDKGKTELTVFVDPKTRLPVQVEKKSEDSKRSPQETWSDYIWDPKIDKSTFSIEPPVGYDFIEVPSMNK